MDYNYSECIIFMTTGNCFNKELCDYNHTIIPKLGLKDSKKEYIINDDNNLDHNYLDEKIIINQFETNNKNCSCCNGDIYNCNGDKFCISIGHCKCLFDDYTNNDFNNMDFSDEDQIENKNFFLNSSANCDCCKGYIRKCSCKQFCKCFN